MINLLKCRTLENTITLELERVFCIDAEQEDVLVEDIILLLRQTLLDPIWKWAVVPLNERFIYFDDQMHVLGRFLYTFEEYADVFTGHVLYQLCLAFRAMIMYIESGDVDAWLKQEMSELHILLATKETDTNKILGYLVADIRDY